MTMQSNTFPNKLRYHHLVVAVLIVLVALILRFLVIYQRAEADPSFIPQTGTDHYFYLSSARGVLNGTFLNAPFLFHPGPSYVFAGIYTLLGSTDFILLTFVIALIDALSCGFLIASGCLLSKRVWGGYLAGGIYALYPVAIFYATTPLIAPLAAFFVSGFILFTLWQREKLTLWRTIILGIFAGLIAIHRLNLAPMVALYGLWLLMLPFSWRNRIFHGIAFGLITIAVIAPFTYLNYKNSGGKFIPIATTGATELYMGNNRDSAGRHSNSFAYQQIDMPYVDALFRDIRVAPEHFYGLIAYKFALFWSDVEPGNNLTFDTARENSSILDALPMRFTWLVIFGLIGLSVLWYQQRESAIFLGLMVGWMCFGYVLVFAFGRIRFPVVIPMTLLSSFGLIAVYESFLHGIQWRRAVKRYALTLIGLIVLFIFVNWTLFPVPKLPPKRTYTELPSDAVRLDANFGEVQLVGWRLLDEWDYLKNAWVPLYESYAVELFWQITERTETRYNFFFAYIDHGQRYDAIDTPIGSVSFPAKTTDEWQTGTIYGEIVSLRLDDDIPQGQSAQIRVGVWYWGEDGLIVNVPRDNGDENILIQNIAVFNHLNLPSPPDLPAADFNFGDLIALRGYDIPKSARAGETINLLFSWEALQNMTEDYSVFLHVVEDDGEPITQGDSRPVPDLYTYNWMVTYPLYSALDLEMPDRAGTYQIYAGIYNESGRLTVDAPDNRVLLGTITVE